MSNFIGKSHFEKDGTQNYLVFQPIFRYFKVITINNTDYILSWKSKGLFAKTVNPPTASFSTSINYVSNKIRVKFNGSCLKQSNKLTYTHKTIVNIYIVYGLRPSSSNNIDPTLKNCLSGAVTLIKNADIYNIWYDIDYIWLWNWI